MLLSERGLSNCVDDKQSEQCDLVSQRDMKITHIESGYLLVYSTRLLREQASYIFLSLFHSLLFRYSVVSRVTLYHSFYFSIPLSILISVAKLRIPIFFLSAMLLTISFLVTTHTTFFMLLTAVTITFF